MAKLQKIKRSNGSVMHSVNIPGEIIEELGWEKGINLDVNVFSKDGIKVIMISKEGEIVNG